MKFSLKACSPAEVAAEVVAVSLASDGSFSPALAVLDAASGGFFTAQAEKGNLPPKGALRLFVDVPGLTAPRVAVLCRDDDDRALQRATATVQQLADESGWTKVALLLGSGVDAIALMARAAAHDAYRFDAFKSNAGKARKHEWVFVCDKAEKKAAQAALDLARAFHPRFGQYAAECLRPRLARRAGEGDGQGL